MFPIVESFDLACGAQANLYSDGDVMIVTPTQVTPSPYFVLTRADLMKMLPAGRTVSNMAPPIRTTKMMAAPSLPVVLIDTVTSETRDHVYARLSEYGLTPDESYVRIFDLLDTEKAQTVADMAKAVDLKASRSAVVDKLQRLEQCGLAKVTRRGSGQATLWLKS